MNKNILVFLKVLIFFGGIKYIYADLDSTLTFWGSEVEVNGFYDNGEVKKFSQDILKKYGMYVQVDEPTISFKLFLEDNYLVVRVKNILTSTEIFSDRVIVNKTDAHSLKKEIKNLIDNLYKKLPANGTIYAIKGNGVRINLGQVAGIKQGDNFTVIRFTGQESSKIDLNKFFSYTIVGKGRVNRVLKYYSIGDLIENKGAKKFDKIILSNKMRSDLDLKPLKSEESAEKLKFNIGITSGALKVRSDKDLSLDPIVTEQDKRIFFMSIMPYLSLGYFFYERIESLIDFQYRKIMLELRSGKQTKATFMRLNIDLKYWFKPEFHVDNYAISLGYFSYDNLVGEPLIAYVSVNYSGPQIGFDWQKNLNSNSSFLLSIRGYPYLFVNEDQIKRGEKSKAMGGFLSAGYMHRLNYMFDIYPVIFMRGIKTKFSGETSHEVPQGLSFTETEYGIRLLLSIGFY